MFEKELGELFTKTITFKLPADAKKGLVTALPWIVLVGGILTLIAAWTVFAGAMYISSAIGVSSGYGLAPFAMLATAVLWVNILVFLAEAVIMFAAFSPLKKQLKKGWDLLYWLALLNAAFGVVYGVLSFNLFSLVLSLLASGAGLYLLFQIRDAYLGGSATSKSSGSAGHKG